MPTLRLKPHETVKAKVAADVRARGVSQNHVVLEILAGALGVRVDGTGRRSNAAWASNGRSPTSAEMPIPVPARVHLKIQREAEKRRRARQRDQGSAAARYSMNEVAERILCDHYGIPYVER